MCNINALAEQFSDEAAVDKAVNEITAEASQELDGFSIQPHIKGRRELVAGLFRDRPLICG